jgi:hypothetical protein
MFFVDLTMRWPQEETLLLVAQIQHTVLEATTEYLRHPDLAGSLTVILRLSLEMSFWGDPSAVPAAIVVQRLVVQTGLCSPWVSRACFSAAAGSRNPPYWYRSLHFDWWHGHCQPVNRSRI